MNTEARCKECHKLLGRVEGVETFTVLVQACQATTHDLRFTVKCPRCGRSNSVVVKYK